MSDTFVGRKHFLLFAASIGLIALLLREQFILLMHVESPFLGDIRQYAAYAINLTERGIFSSSLPSSDTIMPDAFRGPGYPLFLAAGVKIFGAGADAWYRFALHAQAVLGASTVVIGIVLGRRFLSESAALLCGLLMALWPHHIAATGALLSEVLFGFVIMLAMLLATLAHRAQKIVLAVAAGGAFGYGYLINPVIIFFPLVVAIVFWKTGQAKKGACLLAVSLLFVGGWAVRNASLPPDPNPGRGAINLVQGSWPLYHVAWFERLSDPTAQDILAKIEAETRLISNHPARGLTEILARMRENPWSYARWYAFEKPYLLWDWDIRIGIGDVYFLEVGNSSLETNPLLHGVKQLLRAINPFIFLLAFLASTAILARWLAGRPVEIASLLVALIFVYLTAIHDVFQAEPRYAIPYRPFELLLAISAISALGSWIVSQIRPANTGTTSEPPVQVD